MAALRGLAEPGDAHLKILGSPAASSAAPTYGRSERLVVLSHNTYLTSCCPLHPPQILRTRAQRPSAAARRSARRQARGGYQNTIGDSGERRDRQGSHSRMSPMAITTRAPSNSASISGRRPGRGPLLQPRDRLKVGRRGKAEAPDPSQPPIADLDNSRPPPHRAEAEIEVPPARTPRSARPCPSSVDLRRREQVQIPPSRVTTAGPQSPADGDPVGGELAQQLKESTASTGSRTVKSTMSSTTTRRPPAPTTARPAVGVRG